MPDTMAPSPTPEQLPPQAQPYKVSMDAGFVAVSGTGTTPPKGPIALEELARRPGDPRRETAAAAIYVLDGGRVGENPTNRWPDSGWSLF